MIPPAAPILRARARSDPALTFAKLRDVASPHCGVITDVSRFDVRERGYRGAHGYAVTLEAATTLGYDAFRRRRHAEAEVWRAAEGRNGHRVAFDATRAMARAVGEALERYACCTYDPRALVHGSERALAPRAVPLDAFQRPDAEEYAKLTDLAPPDPDAAHRWCWAWRLRDGEARLVPAQTVYAMYNLLPGEPRFTTASSTGWALHHTWEEAVHTGLREVVERDSFILAWLHRLPVPALDVGSVDDPQVAAWLRALRSGGARATVRVTTTDLGIPSFALAVADDRPGFPAFQLTLAAHPDPRRGLRQVVEEAMMMRLDLSARVRAGHVARLAGMDEVVEMSHHSDLYLDPAHRGPAEWLLDEPALVRLADLPDGASSDVHEELQAMAASIARAGHETLFVDGTPPDLREAGFVATKVVVPGTLRHEYGRGVRLLGVPRAYDAPVRMGHRATRPARDEINTDVHPYS